jgi:ABC-type bacteriocin/lantibiotic exporter with double-glycine peptidase domain
MESAPPTPPKMQQSHGPKDDTGSLLNKQFEQDQKIAVLVAELKKKKAQQQQQQDPEQPSYFDKLFSKKKELYKILQLSLIITLGISLHFVIDHYLTQYLTDHEMSFERQLILRLLYPAAVLFILWNLRVFVK